MDFKKLITRFRQFGGFRLVWQYAMLGALWPAMKAGVRCLLRRQSFKGIYPEVLRKIEPYLVKRYAPVVHSKKSDVRSKMLAHEHPKVIWWCWLQGIENAPSIVKACFNSLMREFKGSRVQEILGGGLVLVPIYPKIRRSFFNA